MMRRLVPLLTVLCCATAVPAQAFCGFYVAKADTRLFNKSSKVVLVRDGDRTVLTMVNDYQGPVSEFAMVIPVPTVITREQIHVGDQKIVEHLDAFTSPRLVEYHDENPCDRRRYEAMERSAMPASAAAGGGGPARAKSLGVTIEAQYTVGEYDILVLSAKQSDGLITWLKENGYRMPDGAESVVGSYLRQQMKFFVAKVNVKEFSQKGGGMLRPLAVAYESPKFMLPIRLGTVNANGTQDLFIFAITRTGRVETTNYRTVRFPSDVEIPEYTRDVFGDFYRDMFTTQVKKNDGRAVFLEHAWDMGWCDPCAAEPLSHDELRDLGVFWLNDRGESRPQPGRRMGGGAVDAYVSRLHVRYDGPHFPEDLVFQETRDRSNFQGRYVMRHPYKGDMQCSEAADYRKQVYERQQKEASTLAELTGWNVEDVRRRMQLGDRPPDGDKWYQNLWK